MTMLGKGVAKSARSSQASGTAGETLISVPDKKAIVDVVNHRVLGIVSRGYGWSVIAKRWIGVMLPHRLP
jgi:hypothetical protein